MDNFIFCSKCGTKHTNDGETKFCKKCGKNLGSLSDDSPPAPVARPVVVRKPATIAAAYREDDEEEAVDRLESISHINLGALDVEITKDRRYDEKLGETMLNPVDPKSLPPARPGINYTTQDFEREASALQQNTRQRGVNSTEIKG